MWREFGVLGLGMSRHFFATFARFLLRIVQQTLRLRNNIAIIFGPALMEKSSFAGCSFREPLNGARGYCGGSERPSGAARRKR
jgi:hypothetical protein